MLKFNRGIGANRLDNERVQIENRFDIDIKLFANPDVPLDARSLEEAANLAELSTSISSLQGRFGGKASLDRIVLTPDFHRTAGIPVGSVIKTNGAVFPRAIGNDIGCGMRTLALDVHRDEFKRLGSTLDSALRHAFFEGGRNIPMNEQTREACLRAGVAGLQQFPGKGGIWDHLHGERFESELLHSHDSAGWITKNSWNFSDFIKGSGGVSRDASIATIGGGNHFVEFGSAEDCLNRKSCWEWGIDRDAVTLMIHTGSLDIGASVGSYFMKKARDLWPKDLPTPENGFYPLLTQGETGFWGEEYLSAMGLAANFAVCNRLMLALVAVQALEQQLGRTIKTQPIYDSPHNLIWSADDNHIHRKGACPAIAQDDHQVFSMGHPVIVPGSMGDASYILRSLGSEESLFSAPHGAGRKLARGEGRRAAVEELESIRVVTPVDFSRIRRDVAVELRKKLLEEAPGNYKPILPAIETVTNAGIAVPVVKLKPLLTVKA